MGLCCIFSLAFLNVYMTIKNGMREWLDGKKKLGNILDFKQDFMDKVFTNEKMRRQLRKLPWRVVLLFVPVVCGYCVPIYYFFKWKGEVKDCTARISELHLVAKIDESLFLYNLAKTSYPMLLGFCFGIRGAPDWVKTRFNERYPDVAMDSGEGYTHVGA